HRATLRQLGEVYKQLNAPFGQFGMDALVISTQAIKSTNDDTYVALSNQIQDLTTQRDALADQMRSLLNGAAFQGQAIDNSLAQSLINQAEQLLAQIHALVGP